MALFRCGSTRFFPSGFLSVFLLLVLPGGGGAQTPDQIHFDISGDITAVHPSESFQINHHKWVSTTPQTTYAWYGDAAVQRRPAHSSDLAIGLHVVVSGQRDGKALTAAMVHLENPEDRHVSGFSVVQAVLQGGAEPVYEADGFRLRYTATTVSEFSGKLKSVADVAPGTWVHYQGWRDLAGQIVVLRAEFSEGITGSIPAAAFKRQQSRSGGIPAGAKIIDASGDFIDGHRKVRMNNAGGPCGWHRLAADLALQARVWRVGMRLVPDFEKNMAIDAKARIPYRFYAVDEPQIRSPFGCSMGLILIPEQMVARLKTDDQLAAALAQGVAAYLQLQAFSMSSEKYLVWGVDAGEIAAELTTSWWTTVAVDAAIIAINHEWMDRFREQGGRMALAMMAEAGYDPWAAPEAWRLLEPKKLPANPASIKYPALGKYQLSILQQQYQHLGSGDPSRAPE